MWRKRSSPGFTEHFPQVEVLLGHVWQIHRLILQWNTRHRGTSRHKTRRITFLTPSRDGTLVPIDSRVVPGEPRMAQHHRGHRWVRDKKLHCLGMIARCDECDWYGGVSDVGKWLSVEWTDRDLVAEWGGGNIEPVSQGSVHEVPLCSQIQQCRTVMSSGCPLQSYREESGVWGLVQRYSTRQ